MRAGGFESPARFRTLPFPADSKPPSPLQNRCQKQLVYFRHARIHHAVGLTLRSFILLALVMVSMSSAWAAPLKVPAVTNNAVAFIESKGQPMAYSFGGLGPGKTWRDVTARAFAINLRTGRKTALPPLPDGVGRLASTAVAVRGQILIFGGYTVSSTGAEVSTPDVFSFDPARRTYTRLAPMPIPVDDTVSFVFRDRYVYLVSGWNTKANSTAVQVFDTKSGTWSRATDYPGTAVFGHAGGIVANTFVVMGGVRAERQPNGKNRYAISEEAWWGEIDAGNPLRITWVRLHAPPVHAAYRVAATGSTQLQAVVFVGGTDNPYNYDGIGYNKVPSVPTTEVFSFDVEKGFWRVHVRRKSGTMDHRGLIEWRGRFHTIGGMDQNRRVLSRVTAVKPAS